MWNPLIEPLPWGKQEELWTSFMQGSLCAIAMNALLNSEPFPERNLYWTSKLIIITMHSCFDYSMCFFSLKENILNITITPLHREITVKMYWLLEEVGRCAPIKLLGTYCKGILGTSKSSRAYILLSTLSCLSHYYSFHSGQTWCLCKVFVQGYFNTFDEFKAHLIYTKLFT